MATDRPNILFIMSDDHAAHAIGAYGSRINRTPHIDRLAAAGVRLDNCHCTNSICTPSRATILTGQYGHVTGVREWQALDNRRPVQLQKLLQSAGYATAIFGKWHLGHGVTNNVDRVNNGGPGAVPADPAGFDDYAVLPGHGRYHDPELLTPSGRVTVPGYISDIITDVALDWLRTTRDAHKPFFLCVHHKAPHRAWEPGEKYRHLYADEDIPLPDTFFDDYAGRPAAAAARMRVCGDLTAHDLKGAAPPAGLEGRSLANWYYQRYIKDYLRCVASCDASVGRLLDYLDGAGLAGNTIVIYTSDQGFFLGDHGWYDKRFIYEHSLRMPFVMRYPDEIPAGTARAELFTNLDVAPTLLDYAGVPVPEAMQGVSGRAVLRGDPPPGWQTSFYYRYWDHGGHNVCAHYGVRTATHKLVYFYTPRVTWRGGPAEPWIAPYWELFDLVRDPDELRNAYDDPACAAVRRDLHAELDHLQRRCGDEPLHAGA